MEIVFLSPDVGTRIREIFILSVLLFLENILRRYDTPEKFQWGVRYRRSVSGEVRVIYTFFHTHCWRQRRRIIAS